jgi:hypothetical protein
MTKKFPNCHKMAEHVPNGPKINQHFPLNGPPNYTQIGILL